VVCDAIGTGQFGAGFFSYLQHLIDQVRKLGKLLERDLKQRE
jgi:hypothetical protein